MSTQPHPRLTEDEYLEIERKAEFKSEYLNGEMFPMAGANTNHNRLAVNMIAILHPQLRGSDSEVFGSDERNYVPGTRFFTYPDISVVCGAPRLSQEDNLMNATLIAEVLSPSTEAYDRGKKFELYRKSDSLRQYVLISQDRVHVDVFTKQDNGAWMLTSVEGLEKDIELTSIDCRVPLAELYSRVNFD